MKQALGKGLEALLPKTGVEAVELDIERVIASAEQPRKSFAEDALKELAASIKERGILQPLIVCAVGDGSFKLIAGERRLRAARLAGLKKVPAILRKSAPQDCLEIALIENLQREDLNPMETANGLEKLQRGFNLTQEALADKLGKDRAWAANHLRLLKLPKEIQGYISEGKLTFGHGKAILGIEFEAKQIEAARRCVAEKLSVRQAEELAKKITLGKGRVEALRRARLRIKDPNILDVEERLRKSLGTQVKLSHKGKKGGKIEIMYYSLEQLQGILERLE